MYIKYSKQKDGNNRSIKDRINLAFLVLLLKPSNIIRDFF